MDARRKSQDASSRPPPRPRRPSSSLPSVPLLHTLDPAFAQALGPAGDQVRSTSALSPPPAHFSTTSAYRSATTNFPISTDPQATLRAVTPDLTEEGAHNGIDTNNRQSGVPGPAATGSSRVAAAGVVVGGGGSSGSSGSGGSGSGLGSRSSPNSPSRSIPIVPGSNMSNASTPGSSRRQGIVFNDAFPNSLDSASSSPPRRSPVRPRGHTMDGPYRQPSITPPIEPPRHRVGSVSSTGSMSSMPPHEEMLRGPPVPRHSPMIESPGYTSMYHTRPTDLHIQTGGAVKDKKGPTRAKLMKRASRPTSPMLSPPPSADSLVLPVPTDDANKILWLMKNLCGRMRGEVSYQVESNGPWYTGLCYIEDERGSLMFDSSDNFIFHTAIIPDLRGCRVLPVERPDMDRPCLEVVNPQNGAEVLLWPSKADEADLWLAALLSWQQLRPSALRTGTNSQTTTPTSQSRPELIRRGSSTASTAPNVIKVSLISLWDRGVAHSPRAIVKRASTRDLRSAQTGWRKVSCILYDNGELKLITEHDGAIQCVIPLSQLSRCAIQQLDKSVLDEEFCIAIVPSYASTSTQLSLFRPIFISLEGRVLFEVWFVLMRAFTVPEIYALDDSEEDPIVEVTDFEAEPTSEMFRVEKTINLRIIEAKLGGPTSPVNSSARDRHGKHEQDAFVGNYFVEVHLDGDLRARTITKTATRTPFWRDDCEFTDLSANLPALQVVLKRYEGNMDSLAFPLHTSSRLPRGVNLTEIKCGSVDIPLHNLDRGRDYEEWRQIHDDRQQLIGTLLCKVRHEELIVFMARDYKAISEMLHKFSLGLTAQISEALPGHLRRLAELFLNIFQVTNKSSEWLMALVEDEIDGIGQQAQMKKMRFSRRLKSSEALDVANANEREALRDMGKTLAGEANLLFRGNSLLTQALEFYMRRLGSDYVEEILGDKIYEINEINPNCEVDPGKLQQGEDINQHWDQLIHFTNEIWECIAQSASRFPPELRHILKYIRAVAEDRYGDFLRTVAFTSVSGFLFLRFICPAVLNPKLFGLLRDYPRPRAQRTLTLIAKALQALANLSSIGKKEVWMEPMNRRFLSARRQGLKDFIDEVCSIPAQSASIILPAPYSTPVTILGRLSPLAREGFPSLPFLVDHARNFASLVKLWIDHNKGHTGDGGYDGELLAFHRECTALQERADMCMNRIDAVRAMDHENLSLPTDSDLGLADALEHVSFNDFNNNVSTISRGSSITPWPDASSTTEKPPGSSRGSSFDEERGYNSRPYRASERRAHSRHHRPPPWSVDSYSTSAGSSQQQHRHHDQGPPNVMKSLRTSKNAKKFISGILRKIDRDKFSGGGGGGLDVAPSSNSQSYLGPSSSQSQHFLGSSGSRVASGIGSAGGYDDTNGSGVSKLGNATTSTGTMRRDKEKGKSLGLGGFVEGWNESSRH